MSEPSAPPSTEPTYTPGADGASAGSDDASSAPAPTGETGGLAVTWAKLRRQGWAITGELANAGDKLAVALTRLTAEVERLTRERDELRKEKAGSVWPEGFDATDDASVELAVELVDRTRERDAARAEVNRRKGDPITRLHNLAEGCEQTSGAYDADEFHRLDDEVKRLQCQLATARERAETAEAALARAQKVVKAAKWFDQIRRISAFDCEAMWNAANQISEALRASTPSGEGGGR